MYSIYCGFIPDIDILVIGTGDRVVKLDKEIHRIMREKGIALEVQDTVGLKINILTLS